MWGPGFNPTALKKKSVLDLNFNWMLFSCQELLIGWLPHAQYKSYSGNKWLWPLLSRSSYSVEWRQRMKWVYWLCSPKKWVSRRGRQGRPGDPGAIIRPQCMLTLSERREGGACVKKVTMFFFESLDKDDESSSQGRNQRSPAQTRSQMGQLLGSMASIPRSLY
jgi:hypothetical protein